MQCGYDINKYRNPEGTPAMHLAAAKKDIQIIQSLCDLGCDLNQTDKHGQKPISSDSLFGRDILMKAVASKKPNVSFILKILQCGVKVNAEDGKGQTALFKACEGGNENKRLVRTLLDQGADIHHRDHEGNTPIIVTCKHPSLDIVEVLCAEGANVDDKNNVGTCPILHAASRHKEHLLKYLLQKGANVNATDKNGDNPIAIAITKKDSTTEMIEMLLKNGALVKLSNPKILALVKNSIQKFWLWDFDFDDEKLPKEECKELLCLALKMLVKEKEALQRNDALRRQKEGAHQKMMKKATKLLEAGVSPIVTLPNGNTLLHEAIKAEHFAFVCLLVKHGAQLDYLSEPFLVVAMCCPIKEAEQRLQSGANPNEQDSTGNTVLHRLAEMNNFTSWTQQILTCLMKAGAATNIQNINGQTPLHIVKNVDMCKFLLDNGANVNRLDQNMRTPLAEMLRDFETKKALVELLLDHGAELTTEDSSGQSVLDKAMEYHSDAMLKLITARQHISSQMLSHLMQEAAENNRFYLFPVLLQSGAPPTSVSLNMALEHSVISLITREFIEIKKEEINMKDASGKSPLINACSKDYIDVVRILLEKGAKVDDTDATESTALFYCKSAECIRDLLKAGADPNTMNSNGDYPITVHSEEEIITELVLAGTNISVQGKHGQTPISQAAFLENNIVSSRLLPGPEEIIVYINEQDVFGQTELMRAIKFGEEIKHLLATIQADLNVKDYAQKTALSIAASEAPISTVHLLLQHGADCNYGTSPLIEAFTHGEISTVGFLLVQEQCNPNQTNVFGETLLVVAAQSGARHKDSVLKMLMARDDLNVNATDEHGRTLLHLAAAHKPDLLAHGPFLFKQGADISKQDAYSRTLLHYWIPRTDSLVQLAFRQLLKMYIDVNKQDYNGHTAMHLVVMEDDGEIRRQKCRELLNFGADLKIPDKNGLTVYHLAAHDAQLFGMLLDHAPHNFQGESLSLLHKLGQWFKTEETIFQMNTITDHLNASAYEVNMRGTEAHTNITFHNTSSPSDLAEWTKSLANHFCEIGHRQFYMEKLQQDILCSYPKPKMDELQEKARTVLSLFKDIAQEIGKVDKMMEFIPYISGSCNEGTKVIMPDEMDMLCVLHNWKDLSIQQGEPCPSLVKIKGKHEDKYHVFFRERENINEYDFVMEQTRVFSHFYFLFGKALQNQELWKKYPKLYRIQTDDMSHKNQSITDLSLVWHGDHFPFLKFSVDVVPAFNTSGWLPDKALDHPLLQRNGFLAIPKFRVEHIQKTDISDLFQASFERSEADLFHIMPAELKQAYMLAKVIKNMLPNIELLPPKLFLSSYLLKTCTFKVFQDHHEYQERLKRFIASDKLSAALTQQPYDPQPLARVPDIIRWCKHIFVHLEQAMAARTLYGFFLPGYNLLSANVYQENYRPQLLAHIGRTMLSDPAVEPQVWEQLAQVQPWKIADALDGNSWQVDEDPCNCGSYFCLKHQVAHKPFHTTLKT